MISLMELDLAPLYADMRLVNKWFSARTKTRVKVTLLVIVLCNYWTLIKLADQPRFTRPYPPVKPALPTGESEKRPSLSLVYVYRRACVRVCMCARVRTPKRMNRF